MARKLAAKRFLPPSEHPELNAWFESQGWSPFEFQHTAWRAIDLRAVQVVIVDEWHELMGNKRGVQVQLALARLCRWDPKLVVWGLSATLGNLKVHHSRCGEGGQPMKRIGSGVNTRLGTYLIALWKLFKHPAAPKPAKWIAIAVIAYALSPIDLIPDFIPVLGLLDDVVIVPLGIALAVKLTPKPLWDEVLSEARASNIGLPRMLSGAVFVGLVWAAVVGLLGWWVYRAF